MGKRGRPRKHAGDSMSESRSYWLGDVFVDQGWCWVTDFLEVQLADGKTHLEARPLCLGSEVDIVPVLKGQRTVPHDMYPRRRHVLLEIIAANGREGERSDRYAGRTKGFSIGQRVSRSFRGDYRYRA